MTKGWMTWVTDKPFPALVVADGGSILLVQVVAEGAVSRLLSQRPLLVFSDPALAADRLCRLKWFVP